MKTDTERVHLTDYEGSAIYVDRRLGHFHAIVEDGQEVRAGTLADVQRAVDLHYQKRAKAKKLSLPVLLQNGEPGIVTGINLHTGAVTGVGQEVPRELYPPEPWIKRDLDRLQALTEEQRRIVQRLSPYRLQTRVGSTSMTPEGYVRHIEAWQQTYWEKAAGAEADEQAKHTDD